jgi:hypothetical protein
MYQALALQDLDDPADTGGAEMQLLADLRYGHRHGVEALENAVTVLGSEFIHSRNSMDAARCWQMGILTAAQRARASVWMLSLFTLIAHGIVAQDVGHGLGDGFLCALPFGFWGLAQGIEQRCQALFIDFPGDGPFGFFQEPIPDFEILSGGVEQHPSQNDFLAVLRFSTLFPKASQPSFCFGDLLL